MTPSPWFAQMDLENLCLSDAIPEESFYSSVDTSNWKVQKSSDPSIIHSFKKSSTSNSDTKSLTDSDFKRNVQALASPIPKKRFAGDDLTIQIDAQPTTSETNPEKKVATGKMTKWTFKMPAHGNIAM